MSKETIYREDAIKAVEELPNAYNGWSDAYDKAYIISTLEEVPKADRPQEWIPCSERLPDEGEVVLVCMRIESHKAEWEEQRCIEFGRISSDRYDCYETGWEWLNESGANYWEADWDNSILAWMPLPKPYGEREGE